MDIDFLQYESNIQPGDTNAVIESLLLAKI
jgi:hypothetical protein